MIAACSPGTWNRFRLFRFFSQSRDLVAISSFGVETKAVAALCLIQTGLIFLLVKERRRRRLARDESRDGDRRDLEVERGAPRSVADRDFLGSIVSGVDITEREHADEDLAASQDALLKAFRSIPVPLAVTRLSDGLLLEVNDQWVDLTGYSRDEAVGCTVIELKIYSVPSDREQLLTLLREKGVIRDLELPFRRRSGEERTAVVSAVQVTILGTECKILVARDITDKRKSEKQIIESRTRIRDLAARLIRLQDEERKRIAAELHDGLGQNLAIIRNHIAICLHQLSDQSVLREQLREMAETADSTIDEIREIAHNLRPYELDRLGLTGAMQSMIETVDSTSHISVDSHLNDAEGLLTKDAETSVYRIVQEALNNVIKHADATKATVSLQQVGHKVVVTVTDNGKGFDVSNRQGKNNFGLAGMAERARMLGATFQVRSSIDNGTEITLSIAQGEGENGEQDYGSSG
ncbi:MAG: PAS domain-containing sensor histidine kinase [Pyrinomonadaceae bacterium]|nr:PAS domain-containing sensor histidine kinase [Pyrinomonadaceae bacterium]